MLYPVLYVFSVEEIVRSCPICEFLKKMLDHVPSVYFVEENARSCPVCEFYGRKC